MAASMIGFTEEIVHVGGLATEVRRGGSGTPLLVIHGELGTPGWIDAYQRLAQSYDVIVPSLPGFGRTERPDWIMGARDLAAWVTWFARDRGLRAPLDVIGFSMGGWVAAEIATIAPQFFNKMILVGAMGVKPSEGEIWDYFLESGKTAFRRAFHAPNDVPEYSKYYGREWTPDEVDLVEQHREMTCRVAWKPYMHSLTLPDLLRGVATPTLLVWGKYDAITPLACGERYQQCIPGSRLATIDHCGHMPEMEKAAEFTKLAHDFLKH